MKVQTAETNSLHPNNYMADPTASTSQNQIFSAPLQQNLSPSSSKNPYKNTNIANETYKNTLSGVSLYESKQSHENSLKRYQSRSREKHTMNRFAAFGGTEDQNMASDGNFGFENNLGRVVHRLENRIEGTEIKIASLTNVVKLLQKYTEDKDLQYQKQKQNALYNQRMGEKADFMSLSEGLQIQNKIREFDLISSKLKKECEEVAKFRESLEGNFGAKLNEIGVQSSSKDANKINQTNNHNTRSVSSKKSLGNSPSMINSQFHSHRNHQGYVEGQDLAIAIEEMESRLRQEINKKTDICLKQIGRINLAIGEGGMVGENSNNVVIETQNVLEEQVSHLSHLVTQIENECLRNKMAIQRYMENCSYDAPLQRSLTSHNANNKSRGSKNDSFREGLKKKNSSHNNSSSRVRKADHSRSRSPSVKGKYSKKSPSPSPIHDKEKARLNSKSRQVITTTTDKRKIKENELLQAISRKKETKQKLKNRNF